jgi:phosphoribosyl 1,2-cyclic phosphodiesterase
MSVALTVKFWGVRGSIPSPGPATVRYGGNTPCISVSLGGETLILDAGSGIRALGNCLAKQHNDILVAISHLHWDHVHAFPFLLPLYQPERRVFIVPPSYFKGTMAEALGMDGRHFPIVPEQFACQWRWLTGEPADFWRERGFQVRRIPVNHPGGCDGFRVEHGGRAVVYIPDNEIDPPYAPTLGWEELVGFCSKADILIHDAQYVEADMPAKRGWGHSLVRQACELATAAGVRRLFLFHHDPERTDDELDRIQADARAWLVQRGSSVLCAAATEGETLEL